MMEISEVEEKYVLETENSSGLNLSLHPFVLINISDHFTREKFQKSSGNVKVIGALLGTQKGRSIEIFSSFEIPFIQNDNDIIVDEQFFLAKQIQYKQVFPNYEFLGWYSTGLYPTKYDIMCQQQFLKHNESSIFLQLNPSKIVSKDLPVTIYESVIDVVNGQSQMLFVQNKYQIVSGDEERIAIDHINVVTQTGDAKHTLLLTQLTNQRNAIKMLTDRIKVLYKYIEDVEAGKILPNHEILRQIAGICNRLPTISSKEFKNEFMIDCNDILLISYLSALTKGANKVNNLIDNFNGIKADKANRKVTH
ncbi:Mov34-domain-containing protein [Neocallimastix lanati (nom. inval.)]|uniref:COP9 signalosome complex subunit 6 n=1 Tax=Neocallimastix californiae TaxID=1754190 RepID=A0A1Y2DEJ8_9FUNG|nr:Mov34-domain-containing protein [Neocallimastix sp. JGI-2020a]ORY57669.1 Mov34-domain-containing protein [Neocallimastix californiae]|eukprot:ORY57669.1 Mov34-domain-containing protein [Neocallimastix californiae]